MVFTRFELDNSMFLSGLVLQDGFSLLRLKYKSKNVIVVVCVRAKYKSLHVLELKHAIMFSIRSQINILLELTSGYFLHEAFFNFINIYQVLMFVFDKMYYFSDFFSCLISDDLRFFHHKCKILSDRVGIRNTSITDLYKIAPDPDPA